MKWVVAHFMDEDSVEAVPDTWHRKYDETCAWPLNKHSIKRYIEKRVYPNDLEFQWLPARTLGRNYCKSYYLLNLMKKYLFDLIFLYSKLARSSCQS